MSEARTTGAGVPPRRRWGGPTGSIGPVVTTLPGHPAGDASARDHTDSAARSAHPAPNLQWRV